MKIWRLEVFGREVMRIEKILRFTASDFMAHKMMMLQDDEEYEYQEGDPCAECGEPLTEEDIIDSKFSTMTERLVWDARSEDGEEG